MVLVSSQGYTRIMVGSLWIVTFCFTILPTILDPNMTRKWKHDYDSSSKYYKVMQIRLAVLDTYIYILRSQFVKLSGNNEIS
jgi:hypothetical protein